MNMNSFEYLIAHDIKPSVQRLAIMNYLNEHRTHPTADEIFTALAPSIPTLSRTTIYNTLKLFTQHGVVQAITIDERNEHYDADTSVHAHFLCRECGKIYDAFINDSVIPGEKELREAGHKVDEAYLFYKGVCRNCLKNNIS
jgi:Fe2+ or Zn2+ uptake regulation protein